ncbi:malate dehydrogenase (quinone) [Glutamicibacter sp. MNS18]|uniref:malate dehydrogenase (quinone) n=1 Tax=Glutamicibacter sp. MNS18 TaxID=2989817 RepID=UPI00223674A9|nr:malate dehydrogenase (quinone) [Glutamicibacter sp. MNS18]MCW4465667.1 malate dehydrogenase (quinone) [Glutamicibacter sp. MNS18]
MSQQHLPLDVLVVGAGIIGSTTANLLAELQPDWKIGVVEALESAGLESSNGWHNAGTGHAGLCEFNYTPAAADGSVDPAAAVQVHEQFLVSTQYWAYLCASGRLGAARDFIRSVPHGSFAHSAPWVKMLRTRYASLGEHPLFADMQYSENPAILRQWYPLMFQERPPGAPVAATYSPSGTDVDFGTLSVRLLEDARRRGVSVRTGTRVHSLKRQANGLWAAYLETPTGATERLEARFVCVAAGGGTLPLLQGAGMDEVRTSGGFPISGLFLRTGNPRLVAAHRAKVYSHPAPGAPPLSMPHLDLRVMDGTEYLMFGPFGAFSPRFLTRGRLTDLPASVNRHNIRTLLGAARNGTDLLRFFLGELLRTPGSRFTELRTFVPAARTEDWELIRAGQRVQLVTEVQGQGKIAGFGTQVVIDRQGTLAGVLGASPGASASVSVVLDLLARAFPARVDTWLEQLRRAMPQLRKPLDTDRQALDHVRKQVAASLRLNW